MVQWAGILNTQDALGVVIDRKLRDRQKLARKREKEEKGVNWDKKLKLICCVEGEALLVLWTS